jgi:trigger factor
MTLESAGINRAEAEDNYRETAEKRVKGDFILKKISELESIKIEDEDINNGFGRIAKQYNMTVPEVKEYFKSRDDMLPFINELLNEKILKFLRNEAKYVPLSQKKEEADKEVNKDESAGEEA